MPADSGSFLVIRFFAILDHTNAVMASRALTLSAPANLTRPASESDSLIHWIMQYGEDEVAGSPATTIRAKRDDLQLFLDYFTRTLRSDCVDDWTKSVTKGFVTWLEKEKGNAATTINRRLATVRHFCRWLRKRREFLAGDPFAGITDLDTDEPPALGLTDIQQHRLQAAADKLLALKNRRNHRPRRDYAIFLVLLRTAMRVSELTSVDLSDYDGRYFYNVKRKGKKRSAKVYVAKDAREAVDGYIDHERGRKPGPLFATRTDGRVTRQAVDAMLRELARVANVNLPAEEHIKLHAHLLRHTALKGLAAKGRHFAQKMSGNVGTQHIERYLNPLDADYEQAVEDVFN